jgi:hypothetical protein
VHFVLESYFSELNDQLLAIFSVKPHAASTPQIRLKDLMNMSQKELEKAKP